MQKTKSTSHKQYLCGLLLSRNVIRTHKDHSTLHFFLSLSFSLSLSLSVWKETTHKPSNVAASTNLSSSVYVINMICFEECFLFYVITGRHYFFKTFIVTLRVFPTAMLLCSLRDYYHYHKNKNFRILHYLLNNSAKLIPKFKKKFILVKFQ